ncbi:MAG TPA: GspH/FimT family pseudopilin [Hyphomicrobiales bacterium]|nr:GspH/FimT family pseudopilin [Hyphomicrobiales bacterium]
MDSWRLPQSASCHGFTLLELLVVCALIALTLTLVVPNISGIDSGSFRGQVRRAVATLAYARRAAVVQAMPITATFYQLQPQDPEYAAMRERLARPEGEALWGTEDLTLKFQRDQNVEASAMPEVAVTFFPQGGSTGGVLTFADEQRTASIRIDPITGRIAIAYDGASFDDAF